MSFQRHESGASTGKVLLGCAIVAVVLLIAALVGGYFFIKNTMVTEPAQVESLVGEIAPGAKLPAGYSGKFGMHIMGMKIAFVTGKAPGSFIMAASAPEKNVGQLDSQMSMQMEKQQQKKGGKRELLGTEKLPVGGKEVMFQKHKISGEGTALLEYKGRLPVHEGNVVVLVFQGPEKGFDEAGMKSFLASIKR